MTVICPEHSYFDIVASKLLSGRGCQKCGRARTINSRQLTNDKFIKKARAVHGDKFDYSMVQYKDSKTKVVIKCTKCLSEFEQEPASHIQGNGCKECADQ